MITLLITLSPERFQASLVSSLSRRETVLLHVVVGRPTFLFPSGCHSVATMQSSSLPLFPRLRNRVVFSGVRIQGHVEVIYHLFVRFDGFQVFVAKELYIGFFVRSVVRGGLWHIAN